MTCPLHSLRPLRLSAVGITSYRGERFWRFWGVRRKPCLARIRVHNSPVPDLLVVLALHMAVRVLALDKAPKGNGTVEAEIYLKWNALLNIYKNHRTMGHLAFVQNAGFMASSKTHRLGSILNWKQTNRADFCIHANHKLIDSKARLPWFRIWKEWCICGR